MLFNKTDSYQQGEKPQIIKSSRYFVQDSIVQHWFHSPRMNQQYSAMINFDFLTIGSSPGACKIEIHTLPSG